MGALNTVLGRLRIIGAIEGVSFLVLLAIAMPLKYMAGRPEAVSVVGAAHGALWILYLLALAHAWIAERWGFSMLVRGVLASVFPFGPFIFDRTIRSTER